MVLEDRLDHVLPAALAGHIVVKVDATAGGSGLLTFVIEDVGQKNGCPFSGEERRLGRALAARAARDQCYSPIQLAHAYPPNSCAPEYSEVVSAEC